MEERINVAEILKHCPKGMELDCISYNGVVTLDKVTNNIYYPISINVSCNNENICVVLTEYGQAAPTMFNKCIIFPKGKTTWEGFQRPFKDGDIVATEPGDWIGITEGGEKGYFIPTYCVIHSDGRFEANLDEHKTWCFDRLATETEKAKLFDVIKANGYRWDEVTKTLEKLVESKEDTDDRVVMAGICFDRENYADEVELHLGNYEIEIRDGKTYAVFKSKTKTLEKIEQTPDWSEEDEKILDIITSVLRVNFEPTERFIGCEDYMNVDLINWLKSLKYRYTWKPSDRQIEQLGWIAEQNKNNMIGQELMTLYNDLKKLKE